MPIKRCTTDSGGSGWKYGDSGKCYRSRKDAIKQMIELSIPRNKRRNNDAYSAAIILQNWLDNQ